MPLGPATLYHLNVNCRDLSRSLAFYVDQLGLAPLVRTMVEPQSCSALGIEHGAWDAWMLAGHRGHSGALLDLLEWKLPEPTGRPPDAAGLGYSAVVIETPAAEQGARVDPDGTLVEVRDADHTRLAGVRMGVTDVDRATEWWCEIVGLTVAGGVLSDGRGLDSFGVELVHVPAPTSEPPTAANHLGPYRMALITSSIHDDQRFLLDRGVSCVSEVVELNVGADLPTVEVLCFHEPDGAVVELIQPPGTRG